MKRIAIAAALLLALPAVAATKSNFRAKLTGYQEVPAVNTEAEGVFEANLVGAGFSYTLTYSGLQAPVQQAHIHFAQPSVNGSIIVWLCGTTGTLAGPAGTPPCPGTGGSVSGMVTPDNVLAAATASQQLPAKDLDALIEAMLSGVAYANVHTTASPGGEIRGQIYGAGHFAR
ncbi:MAG TPA: CHRD domain-containing protein [Usitatibacter sp.]|nr:CHRD domain-containing protein [Usitatibacter sp.]